MLASVSAAKGAACVPRAAFVLSLSYAPINKRGQSSAAKKQNGKFSSCERSCVKRRQLEHLYQVEDLFEEQLHAPRGFFQGKDLFFSSPTGYGKSLVFHAIPIVADFLMDKLIGTSCIVIVSPLQSLMLDQVSKLKEIGINAAAIYADQSEEILQEIEEGYIYSIVFISPESMLGTSRWRQYLKSETFSTLCVGIVFVEARCIAEW